MNIKSFFKRRPYEYLLCKYYPFYTKSNRKKNEEEQNSLKKIIESLSIKNIENIVLIASGPSSRNIKLSHNSLYLSTNDSYKIIKNEQFIYFIQDKFIVLRYLKFFIKRKNWKGTFCIVNDNGFKGNLDVFKYMKKYLLKYKRNQPEILISNIDSKPLYNDLYEELNTFLIKEFNYEFVTLNSGFSLLQLATYIAFVLKKPLKIYGLDYGNGGSIYFNDKKIIHNHSAFYPHNKKKTKTFLDIIYKSNLIKVDNYSFFNSNKIL